AEKKSQASSATSWWISVGNLSGEIIDFALRLQQTASAATRTSARPRGPTRKEISHGRGPWQTRFTSFALGPLASFVSGLSIVTRWRPNVRAQAGRVERTTSETTTHSAPSLH